MVYYRKYRPQSLDDLVGQPHVTDSLKKAFFSQRLAQSYLFCGPRGTGKTSTARILAKMVNCQTQEAGDLPCNKCSNCLSITDGSSLDLIEIDAASNRGIDDIRELRERVKLSPTSSKKKVYIIDEVHMLSTEAFNALLKTLEEPPDHALFILATTELHKVPQTILSRVQKIDFKLADIKEVLTALKKVVEGEKLDVEEKALITLAEKSGGSFRDAIKLLDQVSAGREKVTYESVIENLKSTDDGEIINILGAIAANNSQVALKEVLKLVDSGINIKEFVLSLLNNLRVMMLMKHDLSADIKKDLGSDQYTKVFEISKKFTLSQLVQIIDLFHSCLEKMKTASIVSLPLEIAVVESAGVFQAAKQPVQTKVESAPAQSLPVQEKDMLHETREKLADLLILKDKWNYILETIRPYNYSLEAMLKLADLKDCQSDVVVLEVPYSFHQRIIDAPKSKGLLESVMSDVLGRNIRVSTILGKRQVVTDELANVEVAADDEIIKIASEIFNSDSLN